MSIRVSRAVWCLDLPTSEKIVLLAYADFADDTGGRVFPSYDTIADMTGIKRRQVINITHKLKAKGLLQIEKAGGRGRYSTNHWCIAPAPNDRVQLTPLTLAKLAKEATAKGATSKGAMATAKVQQGHTTPPGYVEDPDIPGTYITPAQLRGNKQFKERQEVVKGATTADDTDDDRPSYTVRERGKTLTVYLHEGETPPVPAPNGKAKNDSESGPKT